MTHLTWLKMHLKQLYQNTDLDSLVPIALILLVNLVAFVNIECCIIVFLVLPVVLSSYYIYCAKKSARYATTNSAFPYLIVLPFRTNFFFVFAISSGFYLLGLFEFFVPLLELLPQENFVFIALIFTSVSFFYKVKLHCLL